MTQRKDAEEQGADDDDDLAGIVKPQPRHCREGEHKHA